VDLINLVLGSHEGRHFILSQKRKNSKMSRTLPSFPKGKNDVSSFTQKDFTCSTKYNLYFCRSPLGMILRGASYGIKIMPRGLLLGVD
jgi:hypothetical protein